MYIPSPYPFFVALFASLFLCVSDLKGDCGLNAEIQVDSLPKKRPALVFEAYIENYLAYNFNRPRTETLGVFGVNHNRQAQFALNLGYVSLQYHNKNDRFHSVLGLQAGTYVRDNYAAEPEYLRPLREAFVAYKPIKNLPLVAQLGIQSSHIGFESASQTDNLMLTRSMIAENSPYYLNGLMLRYQSSNKKEGEWNWGLIICKGWQRIVAEQKGDPLAGGTQIKYTNSSKKLTFNWSTFVDKRTRINPFYPIPTDSTTLRFFSNTYIEKEWTTKWVMQAGYDQGWAWHINNQPRGSGFWNGGALIVRHQPLTLWTIAGRLEFYNDSRSLLLANDQLGGTSTQAASMVITYKLKQGDLRMEYKYLKSQEPIFASKGENKHSASLIALGFHTFFNYSNP